MRPASTTAAAAQHHPPAATDVARERFLGDDAEPEQSHLRIDIVASWRRSRRMGVTPDGVDVPYVDAGPTPHQLLRAALPVIEQLAVHLDDTTATILLANSNAQILDRWASRSFLRTLDRFSVAPGFVFAEHLVGTNGLGCALEEKRLFEVHGPEHFRDCLRGLVCVAAPVIHPTTGVAHGALNVTCRVDEANGLLRPIVRQAVADIERRMLEAASVKERMLLDAFVTRARGSTHAVVLVSTDLSMTNSAADQLVGTADRLLLWHWASRELATHHHAAGTVDLERTEGVHVAATRVGDDGAILGAVLELCRPQPSPNRVQSRQPDHRVQEIIGRSAAARALRRAVAGAIKQLVPIVVTGPSGSGRTFVAQLIANAASPTTAPATIVEAGAASVGMIEQHRGQALVIRNIDGTDARSTIDLLACADLTGVRLIATSAGKPPAGQGSHVHLFGHRVDVPPLWMRLDDIVDLAPVLLAELADDGRRPALRPAALTALLRHDWPGNVRELRAALSVALAAAGTDPIAVFHLPATYQEADRGRRWSTIEVAERDAILRALEAHDGNKRAAAHDLGLARSTLYRKLRALDIDHTC
jgi:sigma-54 dependent transcriptional regulator, acetoin dehydrogenase operon transcriptional activator AcoR